MTAPAVVLVTGRGRGPSMGRFADELERELTAQGVPVTRTRRVRSRAAVVHILDHSDAHLAALTAPARTVITCHDLMLLRAREGTAGFSPRGRPLARFAAATMLLRRAARVVCPSAQTRADVVRLRRVPPSRAVVIPNGVSERFRPLGAAERKRARAELGLTGAALLHVDSGQPYKNVEATLRVLARLRDEGRALTLLRVGAGLARDAQALARSLGCADAVRDLGWLDDEQLVGIYSVADVLLFPSHAEGFGWPALEAMACGTSVV